MNRQRAIPLFVLASLALHGAGFYGWDPGARPGEPAKPEEKVIELVPFKPPDEPAPLRGQVVETPDLPAADRAPANARFLAERNLRVDREALGRVADRVGRRSAPMVPPTPRQPQSRPQSASDELGLKMAGKELYPSFRDLWQMVPESGGRIDHIEGLLEGEITALNTQEFRYAAFYNAVKRAVRAYWEPQPAVLRSGMPRHNLDTYLRFVTDADGKLLQVEVLHSCGYPAVDQAAVRAMQQATPFYGVPKGLLNEKGQLDEVFGFHVILE